MPVASVGFFPAKPGGRRAAIALVLAPRGHIGVAQVDKGQQVGVLGKTKPSVSPEDLARFEAWRTRQE